jgi:manganese transport protein
MKNAKKSNIIEIELQTTGDGEDVLYRSNYFQLSSEIISETTPIWNNPLKESSLPEYHGAVQVPSGEGISWFQVLYSYIGPGALVAVGYMDPGNWSTDIAGGSKFGYELLFVILLSSLIAMFLQILALKVGLATGRDLAQVCRDSYPYPVVVGLWIVSEIAIIATDIAEVLGSAIALQLLFGLPLMAGVCVTAMDVLILLVLNGNRFRVIEIVVSLLVLLIAVCFAITLGMSKPEAIPVLMGFLPSEKLFANKEMLYIAVGIIGATVMPHNLFLHSSIIMTRHSGHDEENVRKAIKFGSIDSTCSLFIAFFVNASILMVSAAAFHAHGYNDVATLSDAYTLLDPILNSRAASLLFGIALLASGQNSTLTGTLTGQIVMEGFMTWKLPPAMRRLGTRLLAILPSVLAVAIGGEQSANDLLVLSQVNSEK